MTVKYFNDFIEFTEEYLRIRPWVQDALSYADDGTTELDIVLSLLDRTLYLFSIPDGFAMVEFSTDEDGTRYCNYRLSGGTKNHSLDLLLDCQPVVEAMARKHGYFKTSIIGRKGWIKPLAKHGFKAEPYGKKNLYIKDIS
ncbi:hypothetical protein [Agrobacterium pusense]|uniref:hypothetical protein n=1 Tax=Agrobacterium pusense TaxID=648995 RepID=UPI0022B8B8A5|nr:hypothetical protein [Agrobacterium pusense]MCZ7926184.1 hypothetical protein [Agrobacterium pusense]